MMSEIDLVTVISQTGFPIAIALYLLYERTKTFKEESDRWGERDELLMEIVKSNTVAQTELRSTIQRLCEIVNSAKPI